MKRALQVIVGYGNNGCRRRASTPSRGHRQRTDGAALAATGPRHRQGGPHAVRRSFGWFAIASSPRRVAETRDRPRARASSECCLLLFGGLRPKRFDDATNFYTHPQVLQA